MHMSPPPPMAPMKKKHYTAMTFFWGRKSEVLFTNWPGDNRGMYGLALIVTFLMAAVWEIIMIRRLDRLTHKKGLAKTALHTLRVGLMYILMLAVMSFNGGIFIAACLGHVVGFLLFRSAIFCNKEEETVACEDDKCRDLPSACC
jgi:solute carrier family 31 (copper transporter), member 1